jgi:hypothetical protein
MLQWRSRSSCVRRVYSVRVQPAKQVWGGGGLDGRAGGWGGGKIILETQFFVDIKFLGTYIWLKVFGCAT